MTKHWEMEHERLDEEKSASQEAIPLTETPPPADAEDEGKAEDEPTGGALLWSRTAAMLFAWICMGLYAEIIGPTLPYLKIRVDADYEEISRTLVSESVGFFIGAIFGGFLCDKFNRHMELLLCGAMLFDSVGTAVAPWCTTITSLGLMFHLVGIGQGLLASGGNSYIIQLWRKNADPYVHALHFAFGIGALIAPQLARPFLVDLDMVAPNMTSATNETTPFHYTANQSHAVSHSSMTSHVMLNLTTTAAPPIKLHDASLLEIPYSVVACCSLLSCLSFAILYILTIRGGEKFIFYEKKKDKSFLTILSPGSCVEGDKTFGFQIIILMFFFFALPIGAERAFGKFLFAFAKDGDLQMTTGDAATLTSLFWGFFTAGRGIAVIVSKYVPSFYMLWVEVGVDLFAAIMLAACGYFSEPVIWIFTGIFGMFLAPIFPTGLSWINQLMELTAMAVAVPFLGASVGAMFFLWLAGYLFEYYGPHNLLFIMAGISVSTVLLFLVMIFVTRRHKRRSGSADIAKSEEEVEKSLQT